MRSWRRWRCRGMACRAACAGGDHGWRGGLLHACLSTGLVRGWSRVLTSAVCRRRGRTLATVGRQGMRSLGALVEEPFPLSASPYAIPCTGVPATLQEAERRRRRGPGRRHSSNTSDLCCYACCAVPLLLHRKLSADGGVALQDVTLSTPHGEMTVCKGLSLSLSPGQSLLIVGPSGVGKTSIMRAVAGRLAATVAPAAAGCRACGHAAELNVWICLLLQGGDRMVQSG